MKRVFREGGSKMTQGKKDEQDHELESGRTAKSQRLHDMQLSTRTGLLATRTWNIFPTTPLSAICFARSQHLGREDTMLSSGLCPGNTIQSL